MSIEHHACISVTCDQCGRTYMGYEDEYTVHFDSLEAFIEEQKDYEGEHNQWRIDWITPHDPAAERVASKQYCGDCACEQDGHPREGEPLKLTSGKTVRFCRCGKSWPVEAAS